MEAEDNIGFEESSRLIHEETAFRFYNTQFLDTGIIDLDSDPDEENELNVDIINIDLSQDSDPKSISASNVVPKTMCIKLVDCFKFPWYFDKSTKDVIERISTVNNSPNNNVTENIIEEISKYVSNKNETVECYNKDIYNNNNITLTVSNNIREQTTNVSTIKCGNSVNKETDMKQTHKKFIANNKWDHVKRLEKINKRNDLDLLRAKNLKYRTKADPKKNEGFIGIKVKRINTIKHDTEVKADTGETIKEQNCLKTYVKKSLKNVRMTPVLDVSVDANVNTLKPKNNEKGFQPTSVGCMSTAIINDTIISKELYNIGTTLTPVFGNIKATESTKTSTDLKTTLAESASATTVNDMTKIAEEIIKKIKITSTANIPKHTDSNNRCYKSMPGFQFQQKYNSDVLQKTKMTFPIPNHLKTTKSNELENLAQGTISITYPSDVNTMITHNKTGKAQTSNVIADVHRNSTENKLKNISVPIMNKYKENSTNAIKMQAKQQGKCKIRRTQSQGIRQSNIDLKSSIKSKNTEKHDIEIIPLPLNTIVMKTAKTDEAKIDNTVHSISSIQDVTQNNVPKAKNFTKKSKISSTRNSLAKEPRKQSIKVKSVTNINIDNYIMHKANAKPTPTVYPGTPNLDVNKTAIRRNDSSIGNKNLTKPDQNFIVRPQLTSTNSARAIPTRISDNKKLGVASHIRSHILYDPQAKPSSAHTAYHDTTQFQIPPYIPPQAQYYQHTRPTYPPLYPSLAGEIPLYLDMPMPIQNIPQNNAPPTGFGSFTQQQHIGYEGLQRNKQVQNWYDRPIPSLDYGHYGPLSKQISNSIAPNSSTQMNSNQSLTGFNTGSWSTNPPPMMQPPLPFIPKPPLPSMAPPRRPPPPLDPFPGQYTAKPTGNTDNFAASKLIPQIGPDSGMLQMSTPIKQNVHLIPENQRKITTNNNSSHLKNTQKGSTVSKLQHNETGKNIFDINEVLFPGSSQVSKETGRAITYKQNKVICTAVSPQFISNQPQLTKEHISYKPSSNLSNAKLFIEQQTQVEQKHNEAAGKKSTAYKPGPLSKRNKDNDSKSSINLNDKEAAFPGIGYSPPILPIPPTYVRPEAYYTHFNKLNTKEGNIDLNHTKQKRKRDQDNELEVDVKRANDKRTDGVNMNEMFKKDTLDVSRRPSNVDSDAGYDSDITIRV